MSRVVDFCLNCLHAFLDYETAKTLVIPNLRVGCIFRFIQILILLYVVGYICVVRKSYQENDSVISTVTTKVKGFAFTNTSDMDARLWDVADYVIPPQGDDSFFVLTNVVITPNQTQSRCPALPNPKTTCVRDSDCIKGLTDPRGNGVQTGQCVHFSTNMKTCEVFSWCPLEIDAQPPKSAILAAAENFTVLIKNSIMYPKFNFHRRNILPHIGSSYLKSCEYNQETDPECPIFQLKYMVSEAGEDFQDMAVKVTGINRRMMRLYTVAHIWDGHCCDNSRLSQCSAVVIGGVLGIFIDWSCNLDWPQGNKCHPEYTFRRLDNKNPLNDVATGLNFRFAKYYQTPDGKETRTLIKAYGIRFNVIVFGTAGKFGIVPTIINLAAALALLSLVPPVTDWVMLTCMRKRDLYKRHKVSLLLEDTDAESVLSMGPTYGTQK